MNNELGLKIIGSRLTSQARNYPLFIIHLYKSVLNELDKFNPPLVK